MLHDHHFHFTHNANHTSDCLLYHNLPRSCPDSDHRLLPNVSYSPFPRRRQSRAVAPSAACSPNSSPSASATTGFRPFGSSLNSPPYGCRYNPMRMVWIVQHAVLTANARPTPDHPPSSSLGKALAPPPVLLSLPTTTHIDSNVTETCKRKYLDRRTGDRRTDCFTSTGCCEHRHRWYVVFVGF